MLFNSYIFILLFLPITLIIYFTLNKFHKYQLAKIFLIGMSIWFYGYFHPIYILIIAGSILFNYTLSKLMTPGKHRIQTTKFFLIFGIIANILLIFYFKYLNFFLDNMSNLFHLKFEPLSILMPLGISFFTFQQISFLVDSYRGETVSYTFIDYALFVSFFPQLVAGPIVLHDEMIPQFNDKTKKNFNYDMLAKGIYLFSMGLFKKVLLADTLGLGVNWGYNNIAALSGMDALLVSLMYTLQIYFDFSGYCDMAMGIANMFNFNLPLNFNSPYKSTSIIDFWQRWHMTLTRFLRQYIYFPLGGNRHGATRTSLNILIVFIVSGIWHGANWTFILWGLLHGIAQVFNRSFKKYWDMIPKVFRYALTFCFISFTWIIFRANSLSDCKQFFSRFIYGWKNGITIHNSLLQCFNIIELTYIEEHIGFLTSLTEKFPSINMWLFLILSLFIVFFIKNPHEKKFKASLPSALLCIILLVWSILSLSGLSTFLYFNF